jgi:DNA-binding transcriptional MocR family regulator
MNVTTQYQIKGRSSNAIAGCVERAIGSGDIRGGELLPPVRALAARLKLSPATVAAAYAALRVRGLAHGAGRRGTAVNRRPPLAVLERMASPLAEAHPGARNLANGGPDPRLLRSLKSAIAGLSGDPGRYGDVENRPDLIKLARRFLRADRIEANAIALLNGALDGIERVLQAHLRPGDSVAVEDPSYVGVLDLIAAMGLVAEPVEIDDYGMIPAALARAIKAGARACIVTPRAQNPTGAAFDRNRATELRRVIAKYPDVVVIEDDHAGPVSGVPYFTLGVGRARWAVVRSVSKWLGPDLRLSYLAGDATTVARVEGRLRLGPRWVSRITQDLVVAMWSDAATMRGVEAAGRIYSTRRNALIRELAARGIEAHGRSGLNVWVAVTEETAVVQALAGLGWIVRAGEIYRLRSAPGIRITTSVLDESEAPRLAADIARAIQPSRASHAG